MSARRRGGLEIRRVSCRARSSGMPFEGSCFVDVESSMLYMCAKITGGGVASLALESHSSPSSTTLSIRDKRLKRSIRDFLLSGIPSAVLTFLLSGMNSKNVLRLRSSVRSRRVGATISFFAINVCLFLNNWQRVN